MRKLCSLAGLILIVVFAACNANDEAVDIETGDMCSFCRMAISEKRFAGEILTDENVFKFDDIGCMLKYRKREKDKLKTLAIFVADSETGKWLRAGDAHFMRSATVKTPMGSGLVAFSTREKAGTESLSFDQLEKDQ